MQKVFLDFLHPIFSYDHSHKKLIPTADCTDDKIISIVSIDVDTDFRNCGIEERLISDLCKSAKAGGYLFLETYVLYRDEHHQSIIERYKKLGFYDVREFEIEEQDIRGVILQKSI